MTITFFHRFENTFQTAQALVEFGDTLKQMADVKYALDDNVKQNFLEPLHQLQMKDLKEVMVNVFKLIETDLNVTIFCFPETASS